MKYFEPKVMKICAMALAAGVAHALGRGAIIILSGSRSTRAQNCFEWNDRCGSNYSALHVWVQSMPLSHAAHWRLPQLRAAACSKSSLAKAAFLLFARMRNRILAVPAAACRGAQSIRITNQNPSCGAVCSACNLRPIL
jgi:hypothetical protein